MNSIIASLVAALLKLLSPELVKKAVDAMLDKIEDAVVRTPNQFDDTVVIPVCRIIRQALGVSDDDDSNPTGKS